MLTCVLLLYNTFIFFCIFIFNLGARCFAYCPVISLKALLPYPMEMRKVRCDMAWLNVSFCALDHLPGEKLNQSFITDFEHRILENEPLTSKVIFQKRKTSHIGKWTLNFQSNFHKKKDKFMPIVKAWIWLFQNYFSREKFPYPFPNDNISDLSKLKEFSDDNFIFDENGRKLGKLWEKEKLLVICNFSIFLQCFKKTFPADM